MKHKAPHKPPHAKPMGMAKGGSIMTKPAKPSAPKKPK